MRSFHRLILDEKVEDAGPVFHRPVYDGVLSVPRQLSLYIVTDSVVGTSPELDVWMYESPDQMRWRAFRSVRNLPLSTTDATVIVLRENGPLMFARYFHVSVSVGAAAKAHVRLWATGRGAPARAVPEVPALEPFGWAGRASPEART